MGGVCFCRHTRSALAFSWNHRSFTKMSMKWYQRFQMWNSLPDTVTRAWFMVRITEHERYVFICSQRGWRTSASFLFLLSSSFKENYLIPTAECLKWIVPSALHFTLCLALTFFAALGCSLYTTSGLIECFISDQIVGGLHPSQIFQQEESIVMIGIFSISKIHNMFEIW